MGRDFVGVFEHQEPSPRLTVAWWRCSRRDSQGGDHAKPVGQDQQFGFHPASFGKLPKGFK